MVLSQGKSEVVSLLIESVLFGMLSELSPKTKSF